MRRGESTSLSEIISAAIPPKRKTGRPVARVYHSATSATPNQSRATTICGQARESAKLAYCIECLQNSWERTGFTSASHTRHLAQAGVGSAAPPEAEPLDAASALVV